MPRLRSGSTLAENRARTEARVLEAWHDLLAERGYGAVTLADVAARAGMSRSSLYRYVPDKVTLLQLLIDREVDRFLRDLAAGLAAAAGASERLEVFVGEQLRYFSRQQLMGHDMSTALTSAQHASVMEHLAPVKDLLVELLAEGVRTGEFRPVDVPVTAELVFAVIGAHQMPLARGEVDLDVVLPETVRFVRHGLVAAGPAAPGQDSIS